MKLRFYGDSWYWSWFYTTTWKSRSVKDLVVHTSGFPALKIYFKHLGVDCEHDNHPGTTFYQTVDRVVNSKIDPNIDYNIIFFSSLIRGDDPTHHFDVTNYKKFIEKWNSDIVELLNRLQCWADQNNQKIILIGGQSTITNDIFQKINPKSNFHLLAECILTTILKEYYQDSKISKPFGIFKLSNDFSYIVNTSWDPKLVEHIYNDQKEWQNMSEGMNLLRPDTAHLNTTGQLFLVDLILHNIEKLERTIT